MKLTKATMAILKNFSAINTGILFREGNTISTMKASQNVLAKATVEETFPMEFALYDLNEFLATMSLFSEPDLEFKESYLIAQQGGSKVKYFYTDPQNIMYAPSNGDDFPECDVSIYITSDQLAQLQKSAAIMKLGDLRITIEDGIATIMVCDKSKSTDNEYAITLDGEVDSEDLVLELKMETLTVLPLDYEIGLHEEFVRFKNEDNDVVYWIAVDV